MAGESNAASREQLLRQWSSLAGFGQFALATDDLDALLHRATMLVSEGLRCGYAKVLERLPDGGLLVRAGVGWKPGVVGSAVIDGDAGSAPGYALMTGAPVMSADAETEDRFRVSPLLRDHGIRSVVNVIITLPGGKPFGVLEVDAQEPRHFGRDDVDFLRAYATLLGGAIGHQGDKQRLVDALRDREVLLREMQHRVKNNLQVITSLVALQVQKAGHPDTVRELTMVRDRVNTLSLVHDRLYATQQIDRIELRRYLGDLCSRLLDSHGANEAIQLVTRLKRMVVRTDIAIPLGLIVNEFITNSIKYAFDEGPGEIVVELSAAAGKNARLTIQDNGKGMGVEPGTAGTGIGLINLLARQLNASVEWKHDHGTALTLTLPI